jgi:hypothetical protein
MFVVVVGGKICTLMNDAGPVCSHRRKKNVIEMEVLE